MTSTLSSKSKKIRLVRHNLPFWNPWWEPWSEPQPRMGALILGGGKSAAAPAYDFLFNNNMHETYTMDKKFAYFLSFN